MTFVAMYFRVSFRINPITGKSCGYYRLIESYRNEYNRVCHRTILNIGFINLVPEQLNKIQKILTLRAEGKKDLFYDESDKEVQECIENYWDRIVSEKRIDLPENDKVKAKRMVDVDTLRHKEAREIGAEWMSYQALDQLGIGGFLKTIGWDDIAVKLALTQIISRAVYPASEFETTRWIKENSAVCEITHYPIERITKDKLYQSALDLYSIKDELEQHLSKRTNELFDLDDKIVLYDLTNTYFEGSKRNSKLAQFGRSKEKRNDAKLVVLAMVINPQGFLKYSNIFEGNTSDSSSLPKIIDRLRMKTSEQTKRAVVVMDAGIATKENLEIILAKGYDYLCVSRSSLKDYKLVEGSLEKKMMTNNKEELTVQKVTDGTSTDYYLKVKSPGKTLKESSMKNQFESRFEEELKKIQLSLNKKYGVKKADKINIRIGRAIQKYPSVAKYYTIEVKANNSQIATEIVFKKNEDKYAQILENFGVYFIQTSLKIEEEELLWKTYNTIREIEYTFRTLKTELDLRPIYHKNDQATLAHLHLGVLAYWLVNTMRYQLKQKGINICWKEIIRIGNSQKVVTTTASNNGDKNYIIKRCTEPSEKIQTIYQGLNYKFHPFTKLKSVVHKPEFIKNEALIQWQNTGP